MRWCWLGVLLALVGCGGTTAISTLGGDAAARDAIADAALAPADAAVLDASDNGGADASASDAGSVTLSVDPDAGSPSNDPPDGATPPNPLAADPCAPGAAFEGGDQLRVIDSAGGRRWYLVHVPANYQPGPTQLVLNFHGYTSDPFQQALLSQMNGPADSDGFIVAYPAGIHRAWNAGVCCGDPAWLTHIDDVQFVRDTIEAIAGEWCVDRHRIFATGMSNGGFLSHRLACELSDQIAAFAPVAGVMGVPFCTPRRAVPVLHFHGTADPLVFYNGNVLMGFPSAPVTFEGWKLRNGCAGPDMDIFSSGDASCVSGHRCDANGETILCTIDGGGHTWPGGFLVPPLGKTSRDLDATHMMLDFFARHPLP